MKKIYLSVVCLLISIPLIAQLYVEPEKPAEEPEVPLTDLTPAEPVEEPTEEPTVELEDAVRAREAAEAVHDDFLAWYYSMYPETGKQAVRGVPGECALPYSAGPPDQTVDGHF